MFTFDGDAKLEGWRGAEESPLGELGVRVRA